MTDGYKICVFNVHAREVEENNRMPLGPKNLEGISDTHEKSQWTNLRISAGMGMGDKDGWSENGISTLHSLGSGKPHS